MSFRTTSTGMPRTSIWCRSVVTLVLQDLENGIHKGVVVAKHRLDGNLQKQTYFTISFNPFSGRTLITLRAGLALNICSCFVNGLIP